MPLAWVIENPNAAETTPLYLAVKLALPEMVGDSDHHFFWTPHLSQAIEFHKSEDALAVANVCRTIQPELWQTRTIIKHGEPRIRGVLP